MHALRTRTAGSRTSSDCAAGVGNPGSTESLEGRGWETLCESVANRERERRQGKRERGRERASSEPGTVRAGDGGEREEGEGVVARERRVVERGEEGWRKKRSVPEWESFRSRGGESAN